MFDQTPLDNVLAPFSEKMRKERDTAIRNRRSSGLDDIWAKARQQYQGLDDVNQPRVAGQKSQTLDGPVLTTLGKSGKEDRSTVFVNITRPYTNAGTARVADILLPTGGKRNWDLKPTPVSDVALLESFIRENPEVIEALPEELRERLAQGPEEREASIEEAKTLIEDWLVETKWHSETRTQITESGKVGTGVVKGPFPSKRKVSPLVQQTLDQIPLTLADPNLADALEKQLRLRLEYQPAVECIPVENCFPDMPSCGNDIQNGRFFWEMIPNVSKLEMQDLLEDKTYFANQIQACLEEDPKPNKEMGESADKKKKSYTRWRRTGEANVGALLDEGESRVAWVELELINDRVVKIGLPALDTREFPYRMLLWEARQDSWAGIGIPEQIETPQRGLNASVRAGNDNMGWAVGFQLILGKGLEALDGNPEKIHAYKIWQDVTDQLASLTGQQRNPKDALATIEFPIHLQHILPWIEFWLQMAEATTGLTLLMQGQKATDSVGVSQMLMNSSTTNLRMFVKHWDDDNCAPIIQNMYQWVQLYGPESAKGDAVAHALGSSVLIVRDMQQQALVQLLDRFVQPVYGKSPKKGMDLFLEALQFDPRQLDMDSEEKQQLQAASEEPDPRVEAEQIRSQTDMEIARMRDETERLKLGVKAEADAASIAQAADAVETQTAGNLALEGMKQEGAQETPQPPKVAAPPEPELGVEDSMKVLGLQE